MPMCSPSDSDDPSLSSAEDNITLFFCLNVA